ncbi:MAG: outer membrane beta-barrel protein [Candidatus Aminicenantes bacterium]|nr:outer membrane beta-barrel protein [Candidatus Aminicenantes bacterium]
MKSQGSVRRTALAAVSIAVLFLSLARPAAAQQSELEKAKTLINAGEFDAGIKLLEGYIATIKDIASRRKSIAEAYYLIAKIYFSVGEDDKSDENLAAAFAAFPGFMAEETNAAFRIRAERGRALAAQRQREEQAAAAANGAKSGGKGSAAFRFKVLGAYCFCDSSRTTAFGQKVSSYYRVAPAIGVGAEFGSSLVLDVEIWLLPKGGNFTFSYPAAGESYSEAVDVYVFRWEISLPVLAKLYVLPADSRIRPFVLGGGEIAQVTWNVLEGYWGDIQQKRQTLSKQMDYGLIFGAGADFRLGARISLFLEGRLHLGLAELDNGGDYYGPAPSKPYMLGIFTGIKF